ncbi:MAG: hypothetical protein RLY86_686 [Pseudomonadota bacterium]|jgi:predicted phage terminase large subunit-like protein
MAAPFGLDEPLDDEVDGWVLRPQGYAWADLQKELKELGSSIRQTIEAEVTGLDDGKSAIEERRAKALAPDGFRFFCETYFPHYIRDPDKPSHLHLYLYDRLPAIANGPGGINQVIKAPRGEAKSTYCSQLYVLWCFARKIRRYVIVVMDVFAQACGMIESIKAELEANPRLRLDFPELCGKTKLWREGEAITANGCKFEGVGGGMKLRGRRQGARRPDLVVLDDLENDENVQSKELRDKLDKWIDRAVLNLGDAAGRLDVVYVGTVLHPDAVIVRKAKNPMWRSAHFKSFRKWPDRMDLWDRYEEIVRSADPGDDTDKDRAQVEADAFYQANREEMERGAVVSWPGVRTVLVLMKLRIKIGTRSFNSEQQNEPNDNEDAPFQNLTFWVVRLAEWIFGAACDPSLGKESKKSDPSALIVLGLNRETGIVDVVEAAIRRRVPDIIISDIIDLQRQYRCLMWGIEAVQFQAFLFSELIKRSAIAGVPVPAVELLHQYPKDLRIMSLQPHVKHGLLRFHPGHTALREQLEQYPLADHDDGPDALEMAWRVVGMLRGGRDILVGGTRALTGQAGRFAESGRSERGMGFGADEDPVTGWTRDIDGFIR